MFCNQTELMGVMRDGELAVAWWSAVRIAAALPWLTHAARTPSYRRGSVAAVRSISFCFLMFGGFSRAESPEAGGACPWQPPVEFQCTPAAGPAQSCRLVGRSHLI